MSKRDNVIIDWQVVCVNLRHHYSPLSAVAKQVNSDGAVLNKIARGEVLEVGFSVGVRLLDLHLEHCPELHKGVVLNENLLN